MRAALALLDGQAAEPDRREPLWLEIERLKLPELLDRIAVAQESLDAAITSGSFDDDRDEQASRAARQHYFVDRIGEHVLEMRAAIASARAPSDLPAAWRDFKETEAAIDTDTGEDILPQDHPLWQRYHAARLAIVNARPHDLPGLSIQLRRYAELTKHSDPNPDDAAMFAHVVEQMAALAQERAT